MVHFSKGRLYGLYQKEPFKVILASLQCSDHCGTGQVGWDVFIYLIHTALQCDVRETVKCSRRAGSPVIRNHNLMCTLWICIQPLYIDHLCRKTDVASFDTQENEEQPFPAWPFRDSPKT